MPDTNHRAIAIWLFVVAALIFSMVVLGGVTRLTRSGLSIVEWDPIMGAIPPLTTQKWEQTFEKYRQYPEYQKVNQGMSLDEFKSIFWFEYFHRLLGRSIGLAFLVPFLVFLARKRIPRSLTPQLIAMFVLGGLQGLMGWYMVKSGLVDRPHVSQYRLTAHLALAITIYGYMLWVAWGLFFPRETHDAHAVAPVRRFALAVTTLVGIMIASGGFVAGTKAGFAYNTFPTMNGYWIPEGLYALSPWWLNWFDNVTTVQFNHRLIAWLLFFTVPAFWWYAQRRVTTPRARLGLHLLLGALAVQLALGIATVVNAVPVPLGAAHQAGALVVFTFALFVNHQFRRARVG